MNEYRLQFKPRLARRDAHEMVLLMAKQSEHPFGPFKSDADVKRFLAARGADFDMLVQRCRDYKEQVPLFENLIGSTWTVSGGAIASRVDKESGREDLEVRGPGKIALKGYWALFESSWEGCKRAIENASYPDFLVATTMGIAAVEGYIGSKADKWNARHPERQLTDSKDSKVTLDEKLTMWTEIMSGGKRLDRSGILWLHFRELRSIRDDYAVHPKASGYSISLPEFARQVNLFRKGIAGLLVQLHLLFGERVPSIIIRVNYAPEAEVVCV